MNDLQCNPPSSSIERRAPPFVFKPPAEACEGGTKAQKQVIWDIDFVIY